MRLLNPRRRPPRAEPDPSQRILLEEVHVHRPHHRPHVRLERFVEVAFALDHAELEALAEAERELVVEIAGHTGPVGKRGDAEQDHRHRPGPGGCGRRRVAR